MVRSVRCGLIAVLVAMSIVPSTAQPLDPVCTEGRLADDYADSHPRFERIVFPTGEQVTVLLPADYQSSTVRYPVLYLLHGLLDNGDSWLNYTSLYQTTEAAPLIVVMPDGGEWGAWTDWEDGSQAWETFHTQTLIPLIDERYRTIPDAVHRAIAGYSLGGFGALHYTFRHPDLFGLVGAFSGIDDITHPSITAVAPAVWAAAFACGVTPQPFGAWGDPITNADTYRAHNPTDHAAEFAGRTVYFSVGNGLPCTPADAMRLVEAAPFTDVEVVVHDLARSFDRALNEAGVAHHFDEYGCGIHDYPYFEQGLAGFWPYLVEAFGL